jgi:hypothetical protein
LALVVVLAVAFLAVIPPGSASFFAVAFVPADDVVLTLSPRPELKAKSRFYLL